MNLWSFYCATGRKAECRPRHGNWPSISFAIKSGQRRDLRNHQSIATRTEMCKIHESHSKDPSELPKQREWPNLHHTPPAHSASVVVAPENTTLTYKSLRAPNVTHHEPAQPSRSVLNDSSNAHQIRQRTALGRDLDCNSDH